MNHGTSQCGEIRWMPGATGQEHKCSPELLFQMRQRAAGFAGSRPSWRGGDKAREWKPGSSLLDARRPAGDRGPVRFGNPMALFKTRANLLPATLARMEKPLCSIRIFEQQSDCLFAEGAVARFYWNRHKEFYLATKMPCSTNRTGRDRQPARTLVDQKAAGERRVV